MKLSSALNGRDLAPPDRVRVGWPRSILTLLIALPLIAGGPIRYAFRISLGMGYLVATLLSLALVWPLRKLAPNGLSRGRALGANLIVLTLGVFSAAILYNPDFHGVANYVDETSHVAVDAGVHVYNYMFFTRHGPETYGGFVSMYSFWRGLSSITGLLTAMNVGWLFVLFVVAAGPAVVSFAVLHPFRDQPRAWWIGALTCLLVGVAVQVYLVLPVESFFLMGGFWAQVFGLAPLFLLWMADTLIRDRLLRIVWIFALVAVYRYTYGLNLADLIMVVGALLGLEALGRGLSWLTRLLLLAASFLAFCTAWDCWTALRPIFKDWGWIIRHDPIASSHGQVLAILACLVTVAFRAPGSGIVRALRFPIFFIASSCWLASIVRSLPHADVYYVSKYDFHGVVVAASALVVVAVYWMAKCSQRFDLATILGVVTVLLFANASQDQLSRGSAAYHQSFREQAHGRPYNRSYPWVIPEAVHFMQETLEQQNRKFGGYRATHLPMLTFTNGLFDWKDSTWWRNPIIDDSKGHCIFWDPGHDPNLDQRRIETMCRLYDQEPWGHLRICARCY